ncbi:MAG: hypothetical protein K2X27_06600, partial [Candidatus Obscuribacterales bacterium]|nr:hypothetical protein [Candidatus Obscuribacterales bacterium]
SEFRPAAALRESRAKRLARILSQGKFEPVRSEVKSYFDEFVPTNSQGAPADFHALLLVCSELSDLSFDDAQKANLLRLWFDPFSGCLELACLDGSRDSLQLWTRVLLS